jgi:1-acyl-sn-glycerol-3-phosphate acyltransferase
MFYRASWLVVSPTMRTLFRLRVKGRKQNVPKHGPAILASNHLSFLDHFLLGAAVPRQIFYISKAQHFDRPIRAFLFRKWGVIPLQRGEGDNEAFERSLEVIERGDLYCIYPEGTRSLDGKLHKGHTGVARMAFLTGAPVVPVGMRGTFEALPKGRSMPKLVKCQVVFGAPIVFPKDPAKANDRAACRTATERVMRAIQELTGQEYVQEYQFNPEVKTHGKAREAGNGRAQKK